MNEITLSNSLPIIETEIRQFQNLAGESIFEIGRRLKHVKENDLAHGEFGSWLENVDIPYRQANRFMKVAEEHKSNMTTSSHLGLNILYEIATLPEPERTKEHTTSKGETKTPDEMTVRELRELKKQLKERDEVITSRDKENEILQRKLEEIENQEPEVIEKYMEVVPEDYEELKNLEGVLKGREKHVQQLEKEIADMRAKRSDMDKKSKEYDELNQAINEMNMKLNAGQLRLKNQKMAHDLVRDAKRLVSEVAPLVYAVEWLDLEDNEYAKKPLIEIAKNLNDVSQKIMKSLNEKQIIEVD